jgi:hypothetical protein
MASSDIQQSLRRARETEVKLNWPAANQGGGVTEIGRWSISSQFALVGNHYRRFQEEPQGLNGRLGALSWWKNGFGLRLNR